jgi:lipoyl(octanoyl) transferase
MLERFADLQVRDLGRMRYAEALDIRKDLRRTRKQGLGSRIICSSSSIRTSSRRGATGAPKTAGEPEDVLRARRNRVALSTNRGGDITYHGPGQIVGYPIVDLREWKRDVVAYVRAIEQVIIDALAEFGIAGRRGSRLHGRVGGDGTRKMAAIGVHISRWVTTHGFALNHTTDFATFSTSFRAG